MKDIVLAGIQGSGKGVQWQLIMEKFGASMECFEAGKLLRALQSNDNTVGNYIGSIIDHGDLLPDEFMLKVFDLFLCSLTQSKQILVDGFPRQLSQMHWFLERMKEYNRSLVVIVFDLEKNLTIERLQNRRMCKNCGAILNIKLHDCTTCPVCQSTDIYQRKDDMDLNSVENRIDLYKEQTIPVLEYLEWLGLVRHINANQPIADVFADVFKIISEA